MASLIPHLKTFGLGPADGLVIALYLLGLVFGIVAGRKRIRSVADYLVAGRCAGRYVLTGASGIMWVGLAIVVAEFEKYYRAGFSAVWWGFFLAPLSIVMAAFGWINYRFRATRALTIAQFFEMRYSRKLRIFAGVLMVIAGLLNYAVFPAVSAELLVGITGLPASLAFAGMHVPTVSVVMCLLLGVAVTVSLQGGFISVLICDFVQSQVFYVTLLAAVFVMANRLGWRSLILMAPSGAANDGGLNPFSPSVIKDFDIWFFVLLALRNIYNYGNWPSGQGYIAAARTPHEARMAGFLGEWRYNLQNFVLMALAIAAFALMHDPAFAEIAHAVTERATGAGPDAHSRLLVPMAVSAVLPAGLLGLFLSVLIGAGLARDNSDLMAWSSIILQDVIMPLRGRPFEAREHLRLLRASVIGCAAFVLVWSFFFPLRQHVWIYLNLIATVYLGGSGIVIIGGLYWRRGSTAGAWAAMIVGAALTLAGFAMQLCGWLTLGGMWLALAATVASIVAYAIGSIVCPPDVSAPGMMPDPSGRLTLRAWLTDNLSTLTFGDRIIFAAQLGWTLGIALLCSVITGIHFLIRPLGDAFWREWWTVAMVFLAAISVVTVIWFMIGGVRDLTAMVRDLDRTRSEPGDDGWVGKAPRDPSQADSET